MSALPKAPPAVASPCTSVCTIDTTTGWCAGCGRTLAEIARWIDMTDDEKREVLATLPARRSRLADRPDGDR